MSSIYEIIYAALFKDYPYFFCSWCLLDFKQGEFHFDCAPWILKGKISISILPDILRKLSIYSMWQADALNIILF